MDDNKKDPFPNLPRRSMFTISRPARLTGMGMQPDQDLDVVEPVAPVAPPVVEQKPAAAKKRGRPPKPKGGPRRGRPPKYPERPWEALKITRSAFYRSLKKDGK